MPSLAVAPRLAVRAVKGAPFAFTGAKRKPLTEEAHGLGAGFCQEGQIERRTMTEPNKGTQGSFCYGNFVTSTSNQKLIDLHDRVRRRDAHWPHVQLHRISTSYCRDQTPSAVWNRSPMCRSVSVMKELGATISVSCGYCVDVTRGSR